MTVWKHFEAEVNDMHEKIKLSQKHSYQCNMKMCLQWKELKYYFYDCEYPMSAVMALNRGEDIAEL